MFFEYEKKKVLDLTRDHWGASLESFFRHCHKVLVVYIRKR